jgi:small subunit ribosomal protein S6
MTRKYELVYVVSPDATEAQVSELHTQVDDIVQRMGGQIEKTENWGRRRLAYVIGRHKEGTYVLEAIDGNGEIMKEIERRLKVSDLVIRYLVVRVDEGLAVMERTRAARTATAQRRRIARGLPPDRQPGEGQRNDGDDDRDDRFDMGGMDRMDRMDRDR